MRPNLLDHFDLLFREGEDEAGAFGVGGVKVDVATEDAREHTGDGEAEAGSLGFLVKFDEAVEDGFFLVGLDADAGVGDSENHFLCVFVNAIAKGYTASDSEFCGVGEEVEQYLV